MVLPIQSHEMKIRHILAGAAFVVVGMAADFFPVYAFGAVILLGDVLCGTAQAPATGLILETGGPVGNGGVVGAGKGVAGTVARGVFGLVAGATGSRFNLVSRSSILRAGSTTFRKKSELKTVPGSKSTGGAVCAAEYVRTPIVFSNFL